MLNFAAAVLATLLLAPTQQDAPKTGLSKPKISAPKVTGYVTEQDARPVFAKMETIIRKVTGSKAKVAPITLGSSDKIVTRDRLLLEFARLYEVTKPAFKLIPAPVAVNEKVLNMPNRKVHQQLLLLVKRGAVANYGPLAAGPLDQITLDEFGDAVGFFLARMAQMTHMPSTEFSPTLNGG